MKIIKLKSEYGLLEQVFIKIIIMMSLAKTRMIITTGEVDYISIISRNRTESDVMLCILC